MHEIVDIDVLCYQKPNHLMTQTSVLVKKTIYELAIDFVDYVRMQRCVNMICVFKSVF